MSQPRLAFVAIAAFVAALLFPAPRAGAQTPGNAPETPGRTTPVVFVPGITGSQLLDAEHGDRVAWGSGWKLLLPRDGAHALAPPLAPGLEAEDTLRAGDVLRSIDLLFISRPIYGPLLDALVAAGYRIGDPKSPSAEATLYPFGYDWRRDPVETAAALERLLTGIAASRGGGGVDLVCQSNAARICRWVAKYGGASVEQVSSRREIEGPNVAIERMVLVGASNAGAVRTLRELDRGRRYLPSGRRMTPETLASLASLMGDLPPAGSSLFVDANGEPVDLDLHDATTWLVERWSIFRGSAQDRLDAPGTRRRFGSLEDQLHALQRALDRARATSAALARDASGFAGTSIYQVLNLSGPTPSRVVVDDRGRLWFAGDKRIDRDPELLARVTEPGDGHATEASQRALSAQELDALVEVARVDGGHFDVALDPALHAAVLRFLSREP